MAVREKAPQNPWSKHEEELLRKQYPTNSGRVIGEQLKRSRSSVIAKAQGLGIKKLKPPPKIKPVAKSENRLPRERLAEVASLIVVDPLASTTKDAVAGYGKTLMQLRAGDCRYPFGDPKQPGFFFCGAQAVSKSSYCGAHGEIIRGRKNETW